MTKALPSLPGGTASKVADLYEAAWTVDRLLDLLAGEITELHLEPRAVPPAGPRADGGRPLRRPCAGVGRRPRGACGRERGCREDAVDVRHHSAGHGRSAWRSPSSHDSAPLGLPGASDLWRHRRRRKVSAVTHGYVLRIGWSRSINYSVSIPSRHVRRCYHRRMGGSSSKQPRPSYKDGDVRDADILAMQEKRAEAGDDQREVLRDLISHGATPTAPARRREA